MTTNAPPTPPLEDSELPEATPAQIDTTEPIAEPLVDPAAAPIVTDEQPPPEPPAPQIPDSTHYHNVFPTLVALAADNNYRALISRAEFFDLEAFILLDRHCCIR